MKKIVLIALLVFSIGVKAQIALEHTYDSASTYGVITGNGFPNQLMIIKLEMSGERYININREGKYISIYDMNHALIKTISYAGFPQASNNSPTILYISEQLFDTDPQMEFMYIYANGVSPQAVHTRIYKENGSLIFSGDSLAPLITTNVELQQYPIYNSSQGTKMILSHQFNGQAKVFSLPGVLSAGIQEGNKMLLAQSNISNPYPNPTNNTTRVDYKLPDGINQGEIVFYDLQGKEVKRFKVDRTFDSLLISTADIQAGTYYYQLQTSSQASEGKKMVVVK